MSVFEPQPLPTPPSPDTPSREKLIRNISIGAIIICPALLALPPRKLDIYTVGLISGTFFASNNLAAEYTGRSIVTRAQDRMRKIGEPTLPPKALEVQKKLRQERLQREVVRLGVQEEEKEGVLEEMKRRAEEEEKRSSRGFVRRIWMGGEDDDWKAKRDQREKEALERGEGYGGLIMDQIKEVFGGAKEKIEEVKEVDEKVVEAMKGGKK